jgi:hypothetical protein
MAVDYRGAKYPMAEIGTVVSIEIIDSFSVLYGPRHHKQFPTCCSLNAVL